MNREAPRAGLRARHRSSIISSHARCQHNLRALIHGGGRSRSSKSCRQTPMVLEFETGTDNITKRVSNKSPQCRAVPRNVWGSSTVSFEREMRAQLCSTHIVVSQHVMSVVYTISLICQGVGMLAHCQLGKSYPGAFVYRCVRHS